jgi:hypothetical protein
MIPISYFNIGDTQLQYHTVGIQSFDYFYASLTW